MYPHDMCSVLAYHVPARYVFCSPSRERGLLSVSPCIAYTLLQEIPPREIASQEIASRLHLPRPSQVLCSPVGPLPCLPISLTGGELRTLLTARSAPSVPPPVPPRATVAAPTPHGLTSALLPRRRRFAGALPLCRRRLTVALRRRRLAVTLLPRRRLAFARLLLRRRHLPSRS